MYFTDSLIFKVRGSLLHVAPYCKKSVLCNFQTLSLQDFFRIGKRMV